MNGTPRSCYDTTTLNLGSISSTVTFRVSIDTTGDLSSIVITDTGANYSASGTNVNNIEIITYNSNVLSCGEPVAINGICRVVSGSVNQKESEISCLTENFHIISYDSTTVRLLADNNITLSTTNPVQTAVFTPTSFSTPNYWWDEGLSRIKSEYIEDSNNNYTYIYDSNSNIYQYVEAYKNKLINMGIEVISAELINQDDIDEIPRYPEDLRAPFKNFDDVYGYQVIEEYGISEMNSLLESSGLSQIYNYSKFTDLEKAKYAAFILSEIAGASDEEISEYIYGFISENVTHPDFLPYWAYNGEYYWSGFTNNDDLSICYPWKQTIDCSGNSSDSQEFSIRPVITIPKTMIN